MLFEVQLMQGAAKAAQPRVLRTANFEADDLHSVVSRTYVILSTRGFEPDVDAFRIIVDGKEVLCHERAMLDGATGPKMPDDSTVCIVDDDLAVLAALTFLLTAEGYAVRAHESARAFLDMIEQDDCGCLVTDVRMPGMSGLDLLAKMKERRVSMPVIVITAHGDIPLAIAAMKRGAIHFFEKPFDNDALLDSIRTALTRREESEPVNDAETQTIKERFATLSKREKDVLARLLNGQPNKIIDHELGISARTVEVHRANMMKKTQATSLAELVRMALIAL